MCGNFPSFKKFTADYFSSRSDFNNLWLLCLIQARQTNRQMNRQTNSLVLQLRGLLRLPTNTKAHRKSIVITHSCTFTGRVISVLLSSGIKYNLLLSSPHGKALMEQFWRKEISFTQKQRGFICLEYTHFLVEKHNSCTNDSGWECVQNINIQQGVTENLTVRRSRHASKYIQFWEG